jgi:hypothetical protein
VGPTVVAIELLLCSVPRRQSQGRSALPHSPAARNARTRLQHRLLASSGVRSHHYCSSGDGRGFRHGCGTPPKRSPRRRTRHCRSPDAAPGAPPALTQDAAFPPSDAAPGLSRAPTQDAAFSATRRGTRTNRRRGTPAAARADAGRGLSATRRGTRPFARADRGRGISATRRGTRPNRRRGTPPKRSRRRRTRHCRSPDAAPGAPPALTQDAALPFTRRGTRRTARADAGRGISATHDAATPNRPRRGRTRHCRHPTRHSARSPTRHPRRRPR